MPLLLAAGMAAVAGCQFNPTGQSPGALDGGAPSDARDARPAPGDGQPDANCAWPFKPRHFDPCGADQPSIVTPFVLDIPGVYTYDTTSVPGSLTNPAGVTILPPAATQERGVQTLWVAGFRIASGTTLRVTGTKPLMIVSKADIAVGGIIDVSSSWDPTTKEFDTGAGSQPTDCSATLPQVGGDCTHGGGGGGGGGFSGGGGEGGRGGGTRDCDGEMGVAGGSGGRVLTSVPTRIRGGCAGEKGGNGDGEGQYGVGGAGGGAVHLVSQTRIDIEGAIHAGGAAGAGAEDRRSGGGGGGSGGFIGLEAPEIVIDRQAKLAANGGGGGGGTDNSLALSGQDGQISDIPARGGGGHENANGGAGSAGTIQNGARGSDGDRGGGGGGGGAGFIVIYQSEPTVATGAIISPPHAGP